MKLVAIVLLASLIATAHSIPVIRRHQQPNDTDAELRELERLVEEIISAPPRPMDIDAAEELNVIAEELKSYSRQASVVSPESLQSTRSRSSYADSFDDFMAGDASQDFEPNWRPVHRHSPGRTQSPRRKHHNHNEPDEYTLVRVPAMPWPTEPKRLDMISSPEIDNDPTFAASNAQQPRSASWPRVDVTNIDNSNNYVPMNDESNYHRTVRRTLQ